MDEQTKLEGRLSDLITQSFDTWRELCAVRQLICAHTWAHNFTPEIEVDTECTKCKLVCKHERIENKHCALCHILMGIVDD